MFNKGVRMITILALLAVLTGCNGNSSDNDSSKNQTPTITLTGGSSVSINLGDTYTDAGAVAEDREDGDLTSRIIMDSNVDTSVIGIYQVNYRVTDSTGESTSAIRIVQVVSGSNEVENYAVSWENEFTMPEQDGNGWSILTPSEDSLLIYVSSSGGDDGSAVTYLASDEQIGDDPFHPSGTILPFATIDEALNHMRDGYPDYLLLKRGDTWDRSSSIILKSGRSINEKTVLTAYGSDGARPVVTTDGINLRKASYSAVVGIQFTATKRNPNSVDFIGFDNVTNISGIQLLSGYGGTVTGGILIEDCRFDWFANNTVQSAIDNGGVVLTDIIIRRTIFANNYSTLSHAQGLYSAYASVLLEENIFDHNGWYQQGENNAIEEGKATMFNHNTYFAETRNTIFRKNIFSRASSIGNKFTSNTSSGENQVLAWNILLDNNFYVEGEIGISMGGNDDQDNGPRWQNILVTNNVMTHIGRAQPTGRTLAWGLGVDDWEGGLVKSNIFTTWGSPVVSNVYIINTEGDSTNVEYSSNIFYNVTGSPSLIQFKDPGLLTGITFHDNEVQVNVNADISNSGRRFLQYPFTSPGGFFGNYYDSDSDMDYWFTETGSSYMSLADYRTNSGDDTSVAEARDYVEPDRTLETYLTALGYASDMDGFAEELIRQSKSNWREDLTAAKINAYFRDGFCISGDDGCR